MKFGYLAGAIVGVLALSACGEAGASSDSIKLKFSGIAGEKHPTSVSEDQYFIEQLSELSDGKIEVDYYPEQQLGDASDGVEMLQNGVADITTLAPSYAPDELPLSAVGELPYMYETSVEGSKAFNALLQPGGYLYENEWKAKELKPVVGMMTVPYEIFTTKKPVENLDDLQGLKLKTAGGAADTTARLTGSVPVQLTVAEVYTALERGTVDGRYGPYEYQPFVGVEDFLQYGTVGAHVAGFGQPIAMSQSGWDNLTEKNQEIFEEAGQKTLEHFSKAADEQDKNTQEQVVKENNWSLYKLSDQDKREWEKEMAPSRDSWAERIDKRSKNSMAKEAIEEFEKAVDEQH